MVRTIYTIGHSNRSFEEFVKILLSYKISTVIDVRRFPTSKKYPHFERKYLENKLLEHGIKYYWLGELLGGYRDGGSATVSCL